MVQHFITVRHNKKCDLATAKSMPAHSWRQLCWAILLIVFQERKKKDLMMSKTATLEKPPSQAHKIGQNEKWQNMFGFLDKRGENPLLNGSSTSKESLIKQKWFSFSSILAKSKCSIFLSVFFWHFNTPENCFFLLFYVFHFYMTSSTSSVHHWSICLVNFMHNIEVLIVEDSVIF